MVGTKNAPPTGQKTKPKSAGQAAKGGKKPRTMSVERRAHRAIRRRVGRILLEQLPGLRTAAGEAAECRQSALQASSLRLVTTVPSSSEAAEHAAVVALLRADSLHHPARIAIACQRALREARDPVAAAIIDPLKMTIEAAAHGLVGVLHEERTALIDRDVMTAAWPFDPSIRSRVARTISHRVAGRRVAIRDRRDVVISLPAAMLLPAAVTAHAAAGMTAVGRALGLPKSAKNLLPASIGPIIRRPRAAFDGWATPPRLGRLHKKPMEQRRQVELLGALIEALAPLQLSAKVIDGVIGWALRHAPDLPGGRHGHKQAAIARWITDSLDPDAGLPPARRWTTGIALDAARAAAAEHDRALIAAREAAAQAARRNPDGGGEWEADGGQGQGVWPASADLADAVRIERVTTLAGLRRLGQQLGNCLKNGVYDREVLAGTMAVYAIVEGGQAVGAVRLERDWDGTGLHLAEAAARFNSPLSGRLNAAVRRWVRASAVEAEAADATNADQV